MRHIQGTPRDQVQLLPPTIDELIPEEHPVRVIDAFVEACDLKQAGFDKLIPKATGRPPYHPGDLLKLLIYGYLNQITSSRKLEKACHINLEVIWLLKQLKPDFKTIASFRAHNSTAIGQITRQFILFCRQAGLIGGEWIGIDGSKIKAAASIDATFTQKQLDREIEQIERKIDTYLNTLQANDDEPGDPPDQDQDGTVRKALEKLKQRKEKLQQIKQQMHQQQRTHLCATESSARLMKSTREGIIVGYNAQHSVDQRCGLIIHHELTDHANDTRLLQPMVEATSAQLQQLPKVVAADKGYANGQQLHALQRQGIQTAVPPNRAINNRNGGRLFQKADFDYLPEQDAWRCPAGELLRHRTINTKARMHLYTTEACGQCRIRHQCTTSPRRWISRHFDEQALENAANWATEEQMSKRMRLVEPTFAMIKRLLSGTGRFRCWGIDAARSEHALAVLGHNLTRAINVLGVGVMLMLLRQQMT